MLYFVHKSMNLRCVSTRRQTHNLYACF